MPECRITLSSCAIHYKRNHKCVRRKQDASTINFVLLGGLSPWQVCFWFIPDLPAYSSPTFCLIGLEGQIDSKLLSRSSLKSTAAQLSQVDAKGQIHRVQPLQPLIKLLKGATAFIKNKDITRRAGVLNLCVALCIWFIDLMQKNILTL